MITVALTLSDGVQFGTQVSNRYDGLLLARRDWPLVTTKLEGAPQIRQIAVTDDGLLVYARGRIPSRREGTCCQRF